MKTIDGKRDAVLAWLKEKNPSLLERAQKDLNDLFQMETPGRLKAYRDLYDSLVRTFPNRVWMTGDRRIHEVEPTVPQEECNWCRDEPDEEAHLCPKCGGTGVIRDLPLALDPIQLFLLDPVRNRLY